MCSVILHLVSGKLVTYSDCYHQMESSSEIHPARLLLSVVLHRRAPAAGSPPMLVPHLGSAVLFLRIIVSLVLENFLNTGTGEFYKVFEKYVKRSGIVAQHKYFTDTNILANTT